MMFHVPRLTFRDIQTVDTFRCCLNQMGEKWSLFSGRMHSILAKQFLTDRGFRCPQHSTMANHAVIRP